MAVFMRRAGSASSGIMFQEVPSFDALVDQINQNNTAQGLVQILNDNIRGGGFFLPYSYSVSIDEHDFSISIEFEDGQYRQTNMMCGQMFSLVKIENVEESTYYVYIEYGQSPIFETGWSARYFVLNT